MNRTSSSLACIVVTAFAVGGCEKQGSSSGSGELSAADRAMFAHVPKGSPVVFAGNFMKLQEYMSSGVGKVSVEMSADVGGPGFAVWAKCFNEVESLKAAGAGSYAAGQMSLRMAFVGLRLDQVAACATKAGFTTHVDPDRKFLTIGLVLKGTPASLSYLETSDGAIYTRMVMDMSHLAPGTVPSMSGGARADLEADVADAAAHGSAIDDPALRAIIAKIDRTKAIWFAGSFASTPLGDKVGQGWGTIDLGGGMAFDVSAQIANADLASQLESGAKQAKQMADRLPAPTGELMRELDVSRDGDVVRFKLKITSDQLEMLRKAGTFSH